MAAKGKSTASRKTVSFGRGPGKITSPKTVSTKGGGKLRK